MSYEQPIGPEPQAPTRTFKFKPTEFERANRTGESDPEALALDARALNRLANTPKIALGAKSPPPAENEIHAILRANVAHDAGEGLHEVAPQIRRGSKRKRDYWLLLIGGNGALLAGYLVFSGSWFSLLFVASGVILFSIAITWIMWFVMEDY